MCAVSIRIVRAILAREILVGDDARDAVAILERLMVGVYAGVNDGNTDAGAVVAHQLLHGSRTDRYRRTADEAARRPVEMNALDPRIIGKCLELAV